ncbi:hypothetical protein J6590_060356 [Homalodisca vitripennis]|nr:hypothetical protein J6590_060356 [Homalodisca vitripennis]
MCRTCRAYQRRSWYLTSEVEAVFPAEPTGGVDQSRLRHSALKGWEADPIRPSPRRCAPAWIMTHDETSSNSYIFFNWMNKVSLLFVFPPSAKEGHVVDVVVLRGPIATFRDFKLIYLKQVRYKCAIAGTGSGSHLPPV